MCVSVALSVCIYVCLTLTITLNLTPRLGLGLGLSLGLGLGLGLVPRGGGAFFCHDVGLFRRQRCTRQSRVEPTQSGLGVPSPHLLTFLVSF